MITNLKKLRCRNHRIVRIYELLFCMMFVVLLMVYGIVSYAATINQVKEESGNVVVQPVEIVTLEDSQVEEEVEETETENENDGAAWATASLNVRSGPGTEYSIIGYYFYGDEVSVISSEDGWSKITYRNGEVGYVSNEFLSETEPEPHKFYKGIYEGDVIDATLTYYCSCEICCGKTDGITASGVKVYDGGVACNWLPLGTIITIDGVEYTVIDRGSPSIFDTVGRIDVYTSEGHEAALNMGTTSATVIIVSLP